MNRTIAYCTLIVVAGTIISVANATPEFLSDSNGFLKGFVSHEALAVAGVMLTITLASAGQIHLTLNEIESREGRVFLSKTRSGVHSSAYWLISLFLLMFLIILVKPNFEEKIAQAHFNGAVVFIFFWMSLIMISLTRLIFAIKPDISE